MASSYINQQSYLPLLRLLIQLKKQSLQRNRGQFLTIEPIIKRSNRKIKRLFHFFTEIQKCRYLFCTAEIENIDEAIKVYENSTKKFHLNGHFVYQAIS